MLYFYSSAPTAGVQPCQRQSQRSDSDSAGASTIEHEDLLLVPCQSGMTAAD